MRLLKFKPKIDQISLERLAEYYDEYISSYTYTYYLNNGESIYLECSSDNLGHLLGVGKFKTKAAKYNKYKYEGQAAYNAIKAGEITKEILKAHSQNLYKDVKDKLIYFYLIPEILKGSELFVEYSKVESSRIEAKLIAYSVEKDAVVHLGLDYSETAQKYFPRTFFIERINKNSDGKKFIANGEKINVEKTIIRKADGSIEVIEHGIKKASTATSNAFSTNK